MGWLDRLLRRSPTLPVVLDAGEKPWANDWAPVLNDQLGVGGAGDSAEYDNPDIRVPSLSLVELEALYRQSGLARRIVSLAPTVGTKRGEASWSVQLAEGGTADEETQRLDVATLLRHGGLLAARDGNAAWLPLVEESGRVVEDLSLPLDRRTVTAVRGVILLQKGELTPKTYYGGLTASEGRLPGDVRTWQVTYTRGQTSRALTVHTSRLILLRGVYTGEQTRAPGGDSTGWGDDSVLIGCYRSLVDYAMAQRGRRRALDALGATIFKTALPDLLKPLGLARLRTRLLAFVRGRSSTSVGLLDTSESLESASISLAGLPESVQSALRDVARDSGIPIEALDGQQFGGLGTGAEAPWQAAVRELVQSWQTQQVAALRRLYDLILAPRSPTGRVEYTIEWAPLSTPTAKEAADLRNALLAGDRLLISMGALTAAHVYRSRVSEGWQDELEPALPSENPSPGPAVADPPARDAERYAIPAGAKGNAAKVLRWEKERGSAVPPGTATGRAHDADWTGTAVVSLDLAPAAVEEWRATRDAVIAAGIALEGYGPGDEMPDAPHLTVTYLGEVDPGDLGDLRAALAEAAALASPALLRPLGVVAFDPKPGATRRPVVIELRPTGTLRDLAAAVLRAAAPYVTAEQYVAPRYHVTLGFTADAPDLDDRLADLPPVLPLGTARLLTLRWSDREIARWDLRQGAQDA